MVVVVVVNSWCWPGRFGVDRSVWLMARWGLGRGGACVVFVTLCIARGEIGGIRSSTKVRESFDAASVGPVRWQPISVLVHRAASTLLLLVWRA
jgi:hypothetical protein